MPGCESIHEHLHVVLTAKYMYAEKLRAIDTSNCLQICEEACEISMCNQMVTSEIRE